MNNNPIGIIDSGIGGISIWKEITALLAHEPTIYLSDSKNLPYGEKSEDEVYFLAKRLISYLSKQQVKLIVIACNTITVSALDRLRQDFPDMPIVGTVPVIKAAVAITKKNRIGVLSTNRTAESTYQKDLITRFAISCTVVNNGTNVLVPMVESGEVDEEILRHELQPFIDAQVDVLALGCTHFPFLKQQMQAILGERVKVLDSGEAVARQVQRILERNKTIASEAYPSHTFLTTGFIELFRQQITRLVGLHENDTIQAVSI
jgi:glutamate racemase